MAPNGTPGRKRLKMSLEDLRARLEELRRNRAGQPHSLQSVLCKQTRCHYSHIYVPDPLFDLPSLADVKLFLELDKTDKLPFIEHKFDCDNFAGALRGRAILYAQTLGKNWPFGECESNKYGGHRFNLVSVKPNAYAFFIEPQDDTFFTKTGKFKFIVL